MAADVLSSPPWYRSRRSAIVVLVVVLVLWAFEFAVHAILNFLRPEVYSDIRLDPVSSAAWVRDEQVQECLQILHSSEIIHEALADPQVAGLPLVEGRFFPAAWVRRNMTIEVIDYDVRISLVIPGGSIADGKVLLDGIVAAWNSAIQEALPNKMTLAIDSARRRQKWADLSPRDEW